MVSTDYENAIERGKPIRARGRKTSGDGSNVGRTEPFEEGNFDAGKTTESRDGITSPSNTETMESMGEDGLGQGPVAALDVDEDTARSTSGNNDGEGFDLTGSTPTPGESRATVIALGASNPTGSDAGGSAVDAKAGSTGDAGVPTGDNAKRTDHADSKGVTYDVAALTQSEGNSLAKSADGDPESDPPRGTSTLGSYRGADALKGPLAPEDAGQGQYAHGHGVRNETVARAHRMQRDPRNTSNPRNPRDDGRGRDVGGMRTLQRNGMMNTTGMIHANSQMRSGVGQAQRLLAKFATSYAGKAALGLAAFWIARKVLPKSMPAAVRNAGALVLQQGLSRAVGRYVSH